MLVDGSGEEVRRVEREALRSVKEGDEIDGKCEYRRER